MISPALLVKVFYKNNEMKRSFHKYIIQPTSKLYLFSQVDKLIAKCDDCDNFEECALELLTEAQSIITECQPDFEYDNLIEVLHDQLILLTQKNRKYSINTILYAYSIYLQSSSCYELIRDEKILILPNN